MSEQGTPQPSNPAAAMIDAYTSGDKQAAQRLLDARNAASVIAQPEGENNAPTAFPASASAEQVDYVAEQLRAQPDGERWIGELGGAGSHDFAQNVALAKAGYERIARDMPHILEAFTGTIEREDGTTFSPGDDPSLIWHLAKYERLLRTSGGDALPTPFPTIKDANMNANQRQPTPPRSSASADDRHHELTEQIHSALARGDKYRANKLEAERSRLSKAAYGDGPIVGSGGRNV